MINETRILCFLTLSETHSFTETARLLYMTQQGVSNHIANLEDEMGVSLFTRLHHSVELTEEGKRCYDVFFPFFEQYKALLREFQEKKSQQTNRLRVGMQHWLNFGAAPIAALQALRADIPDFELTRECHSPSTLVRKLLAGTLDMILICGRFKPKNTRLRSIELTRSPMVLLVSKSSPGNVEGATYQSFSKELYLIDAFENEEPAASLLRAYCELQGYGISPENIQVLPNRDSVYTAVELNQGVTVGNSMAQILSSGAIQAYPTNSMEPLLCVWCAGKKENLSRLYAQLLRQEYCKTAEAAPAVFPQR